LRGLSAGSQASQGQFLDRPVAERSPSTWTINSAQLPNRNLDIYAADLNRIEVLEGPQGTLFGAGAEAGRHPLHHQRAKAQHREGDIKGSYGWTAHAITTTASRPC